MGGWEGAPRGVTQMGLRKALSATCDFSEWQLLPAPSPVSPSEMRKLSPGEGAGVVEGHSRKQGVELEPRTADSQACSVPLSEKTTLARGLPLYLHAPSLSDSQ